MRLTQIVGVTAIHAVLVMYFDGFATLTHTKINRLMCNDGSKNGSNSLLRTISQNILQTTMNLFVYNCTALENLCQNKQEVFPPTPLGRVPLPHSH